MKKYRYYAKLLTFVLLFVIIFSLFVTVAFAGGKNDYSKPGASVVATLTSADVLSMLTGEELCEAERAYLELYGDLKIDYGAYIPTAVVGVGRDELTGDFTLKAREYSYVAENGVTVTFLPESATVGDKTVAFSKNANDEFVAFFEASYYDENGKARVTYKTEIEIGKSEANQLFDKAYNDARYWKNYILEKETEYNEALSEYERNTELYAEYILALAEYEAAHALYEEYRTEKAAYDRRLKLYKEYLAELSEYERDYAKYLAYEEALKKYNDDYAAYKEYVEIRDNYDSLLEKYEAYVRDIATARAQIAILDGLKNTSTSLKRSVYSAVIIGTTVTEVIENKDAIANQTVGVDGAVVDLAGDATERLRALCNAYFEIEGEAEKYAFYVVNYEGLRSGFVDLFSALDKLYSNSKVRLVLKEKGMQEKYEILLAQLYYVSLAINDGPVYNYDKTAAYTDGYVVNSLTGKNPIALLDNVPYAVDTEKAAPLEGGYPTEAKKPVLNEVSEPVRPTYVPKPAAPDSVENPGKAPEAVAEPTEPTFVSAPGEPPVRYEADSTVLKLIEAYEDGEIKDREAVTESLMLGIRVELYKQLGNVEFFEVQFLNEDGTPLCEPVLVDKGTYADYSGPVPVKEADEEATYKFAGWRDAEGNACDVTSIESNLVLYPIFQKEIRSYKVIWNIDGTLVEELIKYGEMPVAPPEPKKADFGNFEYVFTGWDKEISAVRGDVTYKAVFRSEAICALQNGSTVDVIKTDDGYSVDLSRYPSGVANLEKIISRVSKNDVITVIARKYSLELSPEVIAEMVAFGATGVSVDVKETEDRPGYSMLLTLFDKNGKAVNSAVRSSLNLKINAACALGFDDGENVSLYYFNGEKRVDVRAGYKNKTLTASLMEGITYYAVIEYSINLLPSGEATIDTMSVARKGEFVKVSLSGLPLGAVVDMLYYIDAGENKIPITDGGFYITSGPVFIGVDYHVPTYTISFVADGKTVYKVTLKYGEALTVPAVPTKPSDSKYFYTDGKWSPEISDVTADAVYVATYVANEHPKTEEEPGTVIFDGLKIGDKEILPEIRVMITEANVALAAKLLLLAFYVFVVCLPVGLAIWANERKRSRR